ncbi:MAG: hypothetical protein GY940_40655 [bacterium]|nr:hypothetical protein [bacterium]
METDFQLTLDRSKKTGVVKVGKDSYPLEQGKITGWVPLEFKAGFIKITGIAQWALEQTGEGKPVE